MFLCFFDVGGIRGVKYLCIFCFEEVVFYLLVFNIYGMDLEVFCGFYKIGL